MNAADEVPSPQKILAENSPGLGFGLVSVKVASRALKRTPSLGTGLIGTTLAVRVPLGMVRLLDTVCVEPPASLMVTPTTYGVGRES